MNINQFGLSIPEGREQSDGYVILRHGQRYRIRLENQRGVSCDAEVRVDGKHVGAWRLYPHQVAGLEHPADDPGHFTFYRRNTTEAMQAGQSTVDRAVSGLVSVTFTPEKVKHYGPSVVRRAPHTLGPDDESAYYGSASTSEPQMRSLAAGMTGLSGQSYQQYDMVGAIDLDYAEQTVINLRLVADDNNNTPRPLTEVHSTYVPPMVP